MRTPRTRETKVLCLGSVSRRFLPRGRAMLDSIRVRLTLWYTGVLAVVLVALSLITYFIFWQSTVQRTDVSLAELSNAFLTTLDAEISDQSGPDALQLAGRVAITEHRFRDHVFAIFDAKGNLAVSSQDVPLADPAIDASAPGIACGSRQGHVLRADDQVSFGVKDRKDVIAKTVFRNGHPSGQLEGVRATLIADFRVERGKKGVGEFRKTHVGALDGALPEDKIGDERQRHQHDGQHSRIPEGETDTDRIKHGSSGRESH